MPFFCKSCKLGRSPKVLGFTGSICLFFIAFLLNSALGALPDSKRHKVIDFEDQLIEGMNKRPLDSLNQLSEKNRRKKKAHLYRKRGGFKYEIVQTLDEMRYTP
jgi:hypothetical protein